MGHESPTVTSDLRVDRSLVQPSPSTHQYQRPRTRRTPTVRGCQRTRPPSPVIVGPLMGCRGERSLPGLGGSSCSLPSSAQRRPCWSGIVSHPQRGSGRLGMISQFVAGSASAPPRTDASSYPRSRTRRRTAHHGSAWPAWAPSMNPSSKSSNSGCPILLPSANTNRYRCSRSQRVNAPLIASASAH